MSAETLAQAIERLAEHRDEHPAPEPEGLHDKYRVERRHDPEGKHADCRYFVLDPQHDLIAVMALRYYAMRTPRRSLARDLSDWLDTLAGSPPPEPPSDVTEGEVAAALYALEWQADLYTTPRGAATERYERRAHRLLAKYHVTPRADA